MRISGGEFSGRIIEAPKGPRIRPTQDQVRAALFNILGERVAGARVLDLFAGSGAMGIEALSRGAVQAVFVDESPFCTRAIESNLKKLEITARSRVLQADAEAGIRKLAQANISFDLVILDPPYGGDLARNSLNALGAYVIVSPTGWVVIEHDKRDPLPSELEGKRGRFITQRIEQYGDTVLTFLSFNE